MNNKKTQKINVRKYVCFFLGVIWFAALLSVPVMAQEVQAQEAVRVGWFEDSYNITGANGERSGYAYEYQQAVAAYTGWTYEYVRAGWSDLLKLMQQGELDLMSGVSYTDERAQTMLYSELPMGEEKYYLYADTVHTDISASDLTSLEGKRVGLLEGSIHATQFYEWEEKHKLHLQPVPITGLEDAMEKFGAHEIDCVVSAETPQLVDSGMSAIVMTGGSDIYFVINPDRPDLKEALDNAMRKMEYDKPFYADELYERYLAAARTAVLSAEEREWITQHGEIRVGWLNHDSGFSDADTESGAPVGVINDYVRFASGCLGNQTLAFELIPFESQEEQIQALKDGQIDMIFHFSQTPYAAEINGFILSNTALTDNMAAVTAQDYFDENAVNRVAIEKGNSLLKSYISYNYPKWEIATYDSLSDVEEAVQDGLADCLIVENGQLTKYIEDKRLHSVYLTQPGDTCFAVDRQDTVLLSILNKTLKTMPASMLTSGLSMYENSHKKVTVTDFIKDNLLAVAMGTISVFLVILLLILGFLKKSRIAEASAKQAASQSLELNKKLQESQHELESALRQAESANAAKTTFLHNMSHDIRTPMNAIVGITNLMAHEQGISDKMYGYIQKVQLSGRHLLGLINDILDMSRIESNEVTLHTEPVSLAEQIGQIDSIIRAQANEHEQMFHIQIHGIVHEYLICDGVRLRQIFLNLLSNSVKYTPDGGTITLDLTEVPCEVPGHAAFVGTVTDNGYGMTPEFLEHIFEPFIRAENSVTNKVQGTGLGMAITKNIVDLMGGEIHVWSEVGKGSRFEVTVTLPVNEDADREVGAQRVLLISGEEGLIHNVESAMSESPVRLDVAATEEEAAERLKEEQPDVILLSGCLENEHLSQTVHTFRQLAGENVLIFAIDDAQEEVAQELWIENGLDGMVLRPFFLSNLALAISRARSSLVNETNNDTLLKGMRFLCAEDNELNAEILREIVNMYGASCTICADGTEIVDAFRFVKPGEYDAILMDMQMPKMNGLEATRAIRNGENPLGRTIPIIAMTANAFSEDVQHCIEVGMDAHVAKPLDIAVLEQTLCTLVKNKK